MADTSYKAAFERGVMRRYKIATSKTPRMTAKALRARRMKEAVSKAKAAKAVANRLGVAKRFRERLARVNSSAAKSRARATSLRRQIKAFSKGVRGAKRGGSAGNSDHG